MARKFKKMKVVKDKNILAIPDGSVVSSDEKTNIEEVLLGIRFEKLIKDYFDNKLKVHHFSYDIKKEDGGTEKIDFEIVSNMPNEPANNIEAAFANWIYRTSDYTFPDFCSYVYSKQPMAEFALVEKKDFDSLLEVLFEEEKVN